MRFSCSLGWSQTKAEDDLELLMFLPPLPKFWDYRHVILHLSQNFLLQC